MSRQEHYEDNPVIAEALGHVHSKRYVDPCFLESLHRMDGKLEPRWNPKKACWEIYRDGLYVMTVRSKEGSYAPLDNRVLQKLFTIDARRYRNSFDFIHNLHLEDERLMGMKRKDQDEFVRACHRDMSPFLRGRHTVNASSNKVMEQDGFLVKDLRRVGVK